MAATFMAAFSFAGAALARKAAAVPPPPPMTPIEASMALMTSNMTIDAKLQAMAATPSLALVPGILSIALAALSMGLVVSIVCAASGKKSDTPHSRADAITESQDIDEAPVADTHPVEPASGSAVEESALEEKLLRLRLEATRQRIKRRIAKVTGVQVQDPPSRKSQ